MVKKAVFFPHSGNEFETAEDLRFFLAYTLKIRGGYYRLKEAKGLGYLEKGSIVFFVKKNYVVGMAIVEEDLRDIKDEINEGHEYKKIIKFFPNSIWAFSNDEFIPVDKLKEITGKKFRQGYSEIDSLEDLLKILAEIKHK